MSRASTRSAAGPNAPDRTAYGAASTLRRKTPTGDGASRGSFETPTGDGASRGSRDTPTSDGASRGSFRLPLAGVRIRLERQTLNPPEAAANSCDFDPARFEILPPWLHQASDSEPIKGANRRPAADVLDRELCAVAALESRARIIQATLVAKLLKHKSWEELGFARLGDYAAERLGLKSRTLQQDARIITALDSLPAISRAFMARVINWTHVRLITTVATTESEQYWLRQSMCMTTRELDKPVQRVLASMRSGKDAADPSTAGLDVFDPGPRCGPDADTSFETEFDDGPFGIQVGRIEDTEEREAMRRAASGEDDDTPGQLSCEDVDPTDPGIHTYTEMDSTCETIVEGDGAGDTPRPNACAADSTDGEAPRPNAYAEDSTDGGAPRPNACAEDSAGGEAPRPNAYAADAAADDDTDSLVPFIIRCTREGRQVFRATADLACRMNGAAVPMWKALESMAAEAMSGPAAEAMNRSGFDHRSHPRPVSPSWKERSEAYTAAFHATYGVSEGWKGLPRPTPSQQLSEDLEALVDDLGVCDGREIDRRLRLVRAAMQRLDWQLGTVLRTLADRKLYQEMGFATLRLYAQSRLGTNANALVQLERHCIYKSMAVRDAYRDGSITYLAATELLKIISEKHERAWVERAQETTLQRLKADVGYALDRQDDRRGDLLQPPPPLDRTSSPMHSHASPGSRPNACARGTESAGLEPAHPLARRRGRR
ncbi:MAG TPA: hypothetical protein VEL28_14385 [Candidatus Binatia bacterium]|nr:hypothetical protein [Candidatus Binatia bacterium]